MWVQLLSLEFKRSSLNTAAWGRKASWKLLCCLPHVCTENCRGTVMVIAGSKYQVWDGSKAREERENPFWKNNRENWECMGENLAEGSMDLRWVGGPYIKRVPLCCGTTMWRQNMVGWWEEVGSTYQMKQWAVSCSESCPTVKILCSYSPEGSKMFIFTRQWK